MRRRCRVNRTEDLNVEVYKKSPTASPARLRRCRPKTTASQRSRRSILARSNPVSLHCCLRRRHHHRRNDEDNGLAAALGARLFAGVVRKKLKLNSTPRRSTAPGSIVLTVAARSKPAASGPSVAPLSYLKLGGLNLLMADLRKRGIATKVRTLKTGETVGGNPLTRGPLAHLLRNRFYIGEVAFKGETLIGEQPAVVDRALFDAVQARLTEQINNHRNPAGAVRSTPPGPHL